MAMDVEESIRSHPFDAIVLIGGCDKTVPAELMGAISADVPAIMITGGPSQPHGSRVASSEREPTSGSSSTSFVPAG